MRPPVAAPSRNHYGRLWQTAPPTSICFSSLSTLQICLSLQSMNPLPLLLSLSFFFSHFPSTYSLKTMVAGTTPSRPSGTSQTWVSSIFPALMTPGNPMAVCAFLNEPSLLPIPIWYNSLHWDTKIWNKVVLELRTMAWHRTCFFRLSLFQKFS